MQKIKGRHFALLFILSLSASIVSLMHWRGGDRAPRRLLAADRFSNPANGPDPDEQNDVRFRFADYPRFVPFPENLLALHFSKPLSRRSVRLQTPNDTRPAASIGKRHYSRFRCVGDENSVRSFASRICVWENVCYNLASQQFSYFQPNSTPSRTILFDKKFGEQKSFIHNGHGFVALHQTTDILKPSMVNTFAPLVVADISPASASPETTMVLEIPHVLYSNWAADDNLGHALWEELAGIWYAMIRMNIVNPNIVPMHGPADLAHRRLAVKFRESFAPAITSSRPVSMKPYLRRLAKSSQGLSDTKDICFDELLVGGNVRRFYAPYARNNNGHEPLFFGLRARILRSFGLDPEFLPQSHRIVITNKTVSNYHPDARFKGHRSFYNLDEMVEIVRRRYPNVLVEVVEWQTMSIREQLVLMQNTTILITPAGGVSMMMPFLPEGGHSIILDYLSTDNSWLLGTSAGESVSMESAFWSYWPHFKRSYYQVFSITEMKPDDPSQDISRTNLRDEASVIVNTERLGQLIDAAFADMAP